MRTVKAPGTEKITTFFPFHSFVERLTAAKVERWRDGRSALD